MGYKAGDRVFVLPDDRISEAPSGFVGVVIKDDSHLFEAGELSIQVTPWREVVGYVYRPSEVMAYDDLVALLENRKPPTWQEDGKDEQEITSLHTVVAQHLSNWYKGH